MQSLSDIISLFSRIMAGLIIYNEKLNYSEVLHIREITYYAHLCLSESKKSNFSENLTYVLRRFLRRLPFRQT